MGGQIFSNRLTFQLTSFSGTTIINNHSQQQFKMSSKYWCFICEKQFTLQAEVNKACPFCQQSAFQQMTIESHPQHFQVYQPTSSQSQLQQPLQSSPVQNATIQQAQISNPMLGIFNIFQEGINSNFRMNQNPQSFNNVINATMGFIVNRLPEITTLMQGLINSGQSYRNASQQQINSLQKIKKPAQCAICQGQSEDENGYKLRCGHQYHVECITQWFNRANTCPTCRSTL